LSRDRGDKKPEKIHGAILPVYDRKQAFCLGGLAMESIDLHCDALFKMMMGKVPNLHGDGTGGLDVTYERLGECGSRLQVFAVFIPPRLDDRGLYPLLESIDLFYEKVLSCPGIVFVRSREELQKCRAEGAIGAMLSLEGVSALQANPAVLLRLLHTLGVRAIGLTWNGANWAADGIMEARGGGLTASGSQFVRQCRSLGILLDASHLSERAFWDVAALLDMPFMASHSNARTICSHPRNLSDEQIKALILKRGLIGVTYVPWFLEASGNATVGHVLRHIDYICSLGGENAIALGSDFDGIDEHVPGLSHPGELYNLRNELLKRFTEEQTRGFMSQNAWSFFERNLPS
jgi:membrane dipeptidase